MRRLLICLGVLVALVAAFGLGLTTGRGSVDEPAPETGITEAEHDRLVDACVSESNAAAECTSYIAELVDTADDEGLSYAQVAEILAEGYEEQQRELEACLAEAAQRNGGSGHCYRDE